VNRSRYMRFAASLPMGAVIALAPLAAAAQSTPGAGQGAAPSGIGAIPQTTPPPPVTSPSAPVPPLVVDPATGTPNLQPVPVTPAPTPPPASAPADPSFGAVVNEYRATPTPAPVYGPQAPERTKLPRRALTTGELDLVGALELGRSNDATWRAALAERDVNRQTANQTITGYLPSANYSFQNIPTESGSRHVATVSQPIVSLGGLATLRQRGPRRQYADSTLEVREQDLAVRIVTAVTDMIKAREASTLNQARIDAFRAQSDRAERLYRAGLGTVTDARDIAVRYEQAQANAFLLKADQSAAESRLRSIIGQEVPEDAFQLPAQFGPIELEPIGLLADRQEAENPQIEVARASERISKLEADRTRAQMLPTLSASATVTRRSGVQSSSVGLSVNAPLAPGSIFQSRAAGATARRSSEERRQVQERAKVELERLYAQVDGGRQALAISAKAIEAAELSVVANSKSYEGGVRTNVDVVNAIQVVYEVKSTYVNSAAVLALNYLNLLLLSGIAPDEAMADTQRFLLNQ
jgi:outer membrane protein TolC